MSATGQVIVTEMGRRFPDSKDWRHAPAQRPVAFADLHTFDLWGLTDRPSLMIGVDILSRFRAC